MPDAWERPPEEGHFCEMLLPGIGRITFTATAGGVLVEADGRRELCADHPQAGALVDRWGAGDGGQPG